MRNRVTTLILRATAIRSWLRISFDTAAAISGVIAAATAAMSLPSTSLQQPLAKRADGEAGDCGKGGCVMPVDDEPGHFIVFIGNDRIVEKRLERQVCKDKARGHALFGALRGEPRELVARAQGAGHCKEMRQTVEAIARRGDVDGIMCQCRVLRNGMVRETLARLHGD